MGETYDLNKAGQRLRKSIETLSGCKTRNDFYRKHGSALGMSHKSFYNLCEQEDLTLMEIQVFIPLIPGFSTEYVIDNNTAKEPGTIYRKILNDANHTDPKDEKIRHLNERLKDRDKIISLQDLRIKDLLEKNDELRKKLGII